MGSFRSKLAASASGNDSNSKDVKVINMQSRTNYGSVVFVPFNPADKTDSVVVLNNVMELMYHNEFTDSKTKKVTKTRRWYRLLSREDYPEITADELDEYKDLRSMASKLNGHKFSKNSKEDRRLRNSYIRFKNYTLLLGWLVEHKDKNGKIINQNCPALLVFSSKRFDEAFDKAMKARDAKLGSRDWMTRLFNDELERKRYISISYHLSEDPKVIGYVTSVSIEDFNDETVRYTNGNESHLDLTPYKEVLTKLDNPLNLFLYSRGNLFSAKTNANIRKRFHYLLNKYCGTNYDLHEETDPEPVPTHDPLAGLKKDDKELPPEDGSSSSKDAWD